MAVFLYPIYTLATFGLTIGAIISFQQRHEFSTILLILVLTGMIYDSLIISIGNLIGEGSFLKLLNRLRFVFHNLLVPTLVVGVLEILAKAGLLWASYPAFYYGSWFLACGLIISGLRGSFQEAELVPSTVGGTLRYKPKESKIPIATIITAICCIIAGVFIWWETQWPWMFVGTLIMLFGNSLPASILSSAISSVVDFVFMLALLVSDWILL